MLKKTHVDLLKIRQIDAFVWNELFTSYKMQQKNPHRLTLLFLSLSEQPTDYIDNSLLHFKANTRLTESEMLHLNLINNKT